MYRLFIYLFVAGFVSVAGCDQGSKDAVGDAVKDVGEAASKTVESAEKTADGAAGAVGDAADGAAKAVGGLADLDLAKLSDASFSADNLKEMVASATPDSLKGVADKIVTAITEQKGVVTKLQDQIKGLGLGDVGELKNKLSSAQDIVKNLQSKLQVVVDKLQASGIDISKYTSLLTGS